MKKKTQMRKKTQMKKKLWGKTTNEVKNPNEEKNTNEEKIMRKNHKWRNILLKKKPQMKKTNVENFKEVTHEIEFMFFSDLVSLTIITCGKLAMKRLEIYCK